MGRTEYDLEFSAFCIHRTQKLPAVELRAEHGTAVLVDQTEQLKTFLMSTDCSIYNGTPTTTF